MPKHGQTMSALEPVMLAALKDHNKALTTRITKELDSPSSREPLQYKSCVQMDSPVSKRDCVVQEPSEQGVLVPTRLFWVACTPTPSSSIAHGPQILTQVRTLICALNP